MHKALVTYFFTVLSLILVMLGSVGLHPRFPSTVWSGAVVHHKTICLSLTGPRLEVIFTCHHAQLWQAGTLLSSVRWLQWSEPWIYWESSCYLHSKHL